MSFRVTYHPDVKKIDLPKIDRKIRLRLRKAIEERLSIHPEVYGKPLQRTLRGYWKIRVGDYRIVYKIEGREILVLGIIHRRDAYKKVDRRIATDPGIP